MTATRARLTLAGCAAGALALLASACSSMPTAPPPLEGTPWRLVTLVSDSLSLGPQQRPPELLLDAAEHRLSGFSGCNRMSGTYALNGEELKLGAIAMTRMACTEGMAIESAFTGALARVGRWRIDGTRLILLDAAGMSVAELEAAKATAAR